MGMRFVIFVIVCVSLSLSHWTFADRYTRGLYQCDSFSEAKKLYEDYPRNVNSRMGYAHCLLTKGEDEEGLRILNQVVDQHNEVKAAFILAAYIETGGTFENAIDKKNINEAISAYQRVLRLIALDPEYPFKGNMLYEAHSQMELSSFYNIPLLFDLKYSEGANGSENSYLLKSPSYKGRRDLNTYPEYRPYTIDSLRKTIEHSDRCLSLPKKRHFNREKYTKVTTACQVMKKYALATIPLEQRRLELLAVKSCSRDILQCPEYDKVANEMVALIKQSDAEMTRIWGEENSIQVR